MHVSIQRETAIESHTVRAGFALAVGLFAWAVMSGDSAPPLCGEPAEREAVAGHTTVVSCDLDANSAAPLRGPARRLFGHRVDLNCSDPLTLQTLSGIGPSRAQAIVDERSRGRFQRVDDLTRVRGIGPKTLARLRSELVVSHSDDSVSSQGCHSKSWNEWDARRRDRV